MDAKVYRKLTRPQKAALLTILILTFANHIQASINMIDPAAVEAGELNTLAYQTDTQTNLDGVLSPGVLEDIYTDLIDPSPYTTITWTAIGTGKQIKVMIELLGDLAYPVRTLLTLF